MVAPGEWAAPPTQPPLQAWILLLPLRPLPPLLLLLLLLHFYPLPWLRLAEAGPANAHACPLRLPPHSFPPHHPTQPQPHLLLLLQSDACDQPHQQLQRQRQQEEGWQTQMQLLQGSPKRWASAASGHVAFARPQLPAHCLRRHCWSAWRQPPLRRLHVQHGTVCQGTASDACLLKTLPQAGHQRTGLHGAGAKVDEVRPRPWCHAQCACTGQ